MRTIAIPRPSVQIFSRIKGNFIPYALTGFLLFLIIIPLARLLLSSFQLGHPAIPEGWTLENYHTAYSMPLFYKALGTTIVISAIGTLFTLGIAVMFAFLIERTDMPLRNLAWSLILIPMAIPGVLFALGWALLLSPKTGVLNMMIRSGLDVLGIPVDAGPLNIYCVGGLTFLDSPRGVTSVFLMVVR